MANNEEVNEESANDFDIDLMEDFFVDFTEAHAHCESTLIALEDRASDYELLNSLFRAVHTIKGNLIYVRLKKISMLLQAVEDVLDAIRRGDLQYDSALSDVILLSLDTTRRLVTDRMQGRKPSVSDDHLWEISSAISAVTKARPQQRHSFIDLAIIKLDPSTRIVKMDQASIQSPADLPVANEEKFEQDLAGITRYGVEISPDLLYFRAINKPMDARSRYWEGRTDRIMKLSLEMNNLADNPVNPSQLAAAVYMHDIGMSFLPLELLHKQEKLSPTELRAIHAHPRTGYDLLRRLQIWEEAAEIVLQHHERIDGKGYPKKLTEMEICDGAKILAIADTFEARTHQRAHQAQVKRPFMRAILEINACANAQFCESWTAIFNDVIRNTKIL